jgi:hypothetical protein
MDNFPATLTAFNAVPGISGQIQSPAGLCPCGVFDSRPFVGPAGDRIVLGWRFLDGSSRGGYLLQRLTTRDQFKGPWPWERRKAGHTSGTHRFRVSGCLGRVLEVAAEVSLVNVQAGWHKSRRPDAPHRGLFLTAPPAAARLSAKEVMQK